MMLDILRRKVPTLATLKRLVRELSHYAAALHRAHLSVPAAVQDRRRMWFFEQRGRATYDARGYRILWQTWSD